MVDTLNQGDEEQNDTSADVEVELNDGFTFTITPEESVQLGIGNYRVGHECVFMVKVVLTKNDNATLTFQAVEIEKVGIDALPSDLVGTSPKYRAAMTPKMDKNKVLFVRPITEPSQ